jgi:hypothetical protein
MKTLLLFLLSVSPALAAHNVTVVVDGETLTCSSGGGAVCDCRLFRNTWGELTYAITYNGEDLTLSGYTYANKIVALEKCKAEIRNLDVCR